MPAKRKNTPPKVHVATALEYAAQRAGLNHSDLADLCDVSKQAMSRRFDERKNISVGVAAQIAEAAGYELALVPQGSDYPPETRLECARPGRKARPRRQALMEGVA